MHGEIGAPVGQRFLEFLDEQALAPNVREWLIELAVTLRGQAQ
jgi:hypothetical protein